MRPRQIVTNNSRVKHAHINPQPSKQSQTIVSNNMKSVASVILVVAFIGMIVMGLMAMSAQASEKYDRHLLLGYLLASQGRGQGLQYMPYPV